MPPVFGPASVSDGGTAAREIIARTLRGLAARDRPFTGLLYAGLMMTRDGPKVVEFNCRFGDPETQALLPVLVGEHRLIDLMRTVAVGDSVPHGIAETRGACVATVLAAGNYPDAPRTGDPITLPAAADGIFVFHAGTARHADGRLVTSGGRVIAVSATGETVAIAQQRSLEYARRVEFRGKQLRTDIGWREIAREQERAHAGTARN